MLRKVKQIQEIYPLILEKILLKMKRNYLKKIKKLYIVLIRLILKKSNTIII